MSSGSARGCDGWSVSELKHLPIELPDLLAKLFYFIEEQGVWPICSGMPAVYPLTLCSGLILNNSLGDCSCLRSRLWALIICTLPLALYEQVALLPGTRRDVRLAD